jgi:elongation factor Ts
MVDILASMVANLRAKTGLGMMECKKALVEAEGDMACAEDILRIKSGSKALKLANRIATEGIVVLRINQPVGVLVEVNCETDFVAKDANFVDFANKVVQVIQQKNPTNITALSQATTDQGLTVEALRQAVIAKMGENIFIRRFVRYETANKLASYLHGDKIGVMVDYMGGDEHLGHDIAMHVAAYKPLCIDKNQVSPDTLERERRIYQEQALQSGKSADIVKKMVEGRVTKFLAEVTLLGQAFVKEPDVTVSALLTKKQATINRFECFVVGEDINK